LLLFITLSIIEARNIVGWLSFLDRFERRVNESSSVVAPKGIEFVAQEETEMARPEYARYGWGWTYPILSMLLSRGPVRIIVLNPKNGAGLFDPKGPLPDLHGRHW
jgi:hypothetical protein